MKFKTQSESYQTPEMSFLPVGAETLLCASPECSSSLEDYTEQTYEW